MKHLLFCLSFIGFICAGFITGGLRDTAEAQVNVSGTWQAVYFLGGGDFPQSFTLTHDGGPSFSGTGGGGGHRYNVSGSISGNSFNFTSVYTTTTYTAVSVGTVDGETMSGTWTAPGQSGTWSATRKPATLTPSTKIKEAPTVEVVVNDITITLKKFSKVQEKKPKKNNRKARLAALFVRNLAAVRRFAAKSKLTFKYEVSLRREGVAKLRKINSKKNIVAVKDLEDGSYTTTYRVIAFKDEQKIFTTNVSPPTSFVIGAL